MQARYPLAVISGLLTIVVYLPLSLVAYVCSPTAHSPWESWLSDLGTMVLSPHGAVYYRTAGVLTRVGRLLVARASSGGKCCCGGR